MIARHGVPALDAKERAAVLDYLETAFPQRTPSGGFQSPFLKR